MPFILYIAIVCLTVGAIAGALVPVAAKSDDPDAPSIGRFCRRVAASGLVLGAVVLPVMSAVTVVPANSVGVATNFGRWSGTLSSGWHITLPWTRVDTFPTRIQKSDRDRGDKGEYDCVPVKFRSGATGCVDLTVLYRIDAVNAETLWRGWGSFERLNTDLVNRSTDDAAGYTFGQQPPFDAVDGSKRQVITDDLTSRLRRALDEKGIDLDSVTLGAVYLSTEAQTQVNDLLNKDTAIRAAEKDTELRQKQKDAEIAAANKDLELANAERAAAQARQVGLTPEALTRECLAVVREVKPQVMPDCGLGSAGSVTPLVQVAR